MSSKAATPNTFSSHGTAQDVWDQLFPVSEDIVLRASVGSIQEACSGFWTQTLVPEIPGAVFEDIVQTQKPQRSLSITDKEIGGGLAFSKPSNLQFAHLREGSQLGARRNASLRNLALLAHSGSENEQIGSSQQQLAMETPAQFLEWFDTIERQVAEGQDQEALSYAEHLQHRTAQCNDMQRCVEEIQQVLKRMEAAYTHVRKQTAGVQSASAELQSRRDKLSDASQQIQAQLDIYNSLGAITQLFNSPGDSVCLDPGFLPALESAERAIGFIEEHPDGRDSELYLMRFSQCRMRALTLIKLHALRIFKTIGSEIASSGADSKALYVRFRAPVARLAPLISALQQRAEAIVEAAETASSDTGGTEAAILSDVQNAYFGVRKIWLRPYIQGHLKQISNEHQGLAPDSPVARVDALRDWCAFVMNVCADEGRIYRDFFTDSKPMPPELRAYLESIMTIFHEHVRPLIIHEADVGILAELSMILLTYRRPMTPEAGLMSGSESEDFADADADPDADGLDSFYNVIDQILQDSQHRLAYKTQAFIRSKIASYKISKEDTEAMAKWVQVCSHLHVSDPEHLIKLVSQSSTMVDLQDSVTEVFKEKLPSTRSSSFVEVSAAINASPDPLLELTSEQAQTLQWVYPPVSSCRWLIAQIDGCLDYEVQIGLTEEAQAACKQNLLGHAARFVRDAGSKNSLSEADAEQQAHLFVTFNLTKIDILPSHY
ncbi:Golgi transport complex subunit 3 [Coemansia sp. IMI 203386]|nr:Golgi transport complex subunit 3 [Coemansia sp. IMI 203386]